MSDATTTTRPDLTLTDAAQARALAFLAEEGDPAGKGLRLGVNAGGCSGFSYTVAIDDKKSDDLVYPFDGFEVFVDPVSYPFVKGIVVDYVDTIGQAGFAFDNPQAQSSCGCGVSFNL